MKCLSLWQPWASAIALGHKRIETRHWLTSYRGPLAIHAAKRWTKDEREFAAVEHALGRMPKCIPLGAIVALATLADIERTENLISEIGPLERMYGNYSRGRYGWMLTDIRPLTEPIPFTGRQGLYDVPDDLVAHMETR